MEIDVSYRLKGGELHEFVRSIDSMKDIKIMCGDVFIAAFDPNHLEFIIIEGKE